MATYQLQPTKSKRIESIYALKAICSFFVVIMHSEIYQREWMMFIIGVGTPCFLSITGYLLFSDSMEKEQQKCTRWAAKSFRLSLICAAIYLVAFLSMGRKFTWWDILINLITGDRICYVLWYLTALWEALLLFALIRTYIPKLIYYLPLIFLLAYAIRIHPDIICPGLDICEQDRLRNNAIVTALPFLCTGYLVNKHKDWLLDRINIPLWLPLVVLALLGEYAARVFSGNPFGAFSILSYPCVVLLILGCIKYPQFKIPVINWIGEKHSANIYYFHVLVQVILRPASWTVFRFEAIELWLLCIPISIIFNFCLSHTKRFFTGQA